MISIRSAARLGARVAPRIATGASSRPLIARPALRAATAALVSKSTPFSTSSLLRKSDTSAVSTPDDVDTELSAKLKTEMQFENEAKDESAPVAIKEFLENSPFKLTDTPGSEEVTLTREYGEEKITVKFSIADLANIAEDDAFNEDYEVDGERSSGEEGAEEDEAEPPQPPFRIQVVVEKPGKAPGALNVDVTGTNEGTVIQNVSFFKDPKLALTASPQDEFASQEVYPGPPFATLDEELQTLMERYLEERGINEGLLAFAMDYMEHKEQKEYVSWLSNVKEFVDA